MNPYPYLKNRFWQMRKKVHFSSVQADLYDALLGVCNSLHWENPFWHTNTLVRGLVGCTEKTLIKARNALKQKGLIDFVSGSKNEATVYTLIHLNDYCKNYSEKGSDKYSDAGSDKGQNGIDLIKTKEERVNKKEESVSEEATHTHMEEKIFQMEQDLKALKEQQARQKKKKKPSPHSAAPPPAELPLNGQTRPESWQQVAEYVTQQTGVNGRAAEEFAKNFLSVMKRDGWTSRNGLPVHDWTGAVDQHIRNDTRYLKPALDRTAPLGSYSSRAAPDGAKLQKDRKLRECSDLLSPLTFNHDERSKWNEYLRGKERTVEELDAAHDRLKSIIAKRLTNTS